MTDTAMDWVELTAEEIAGKVGEAMNYARPNTTFRDLLKIAAMMGMSAGLAQAQKEFKKNAEEVYGAAVGS